MSIFSPAEGKTVTPNQYYRFRLFPRFNVVGVLLQDFCVDIHASIDQWRIGWEEFHPNEIRSDAYHGLQDSLPFDSFENIGRRVVLPSFTTLSPWHYHKTYQDAMAIVQKFGEPTLFIAFTRNPTWLEIRRELLPIQTTAKRSDLVARVFWLKLLDILDILKACLGPTIADVWIMEYQKRGLLHGHIVRWLQNADGVLTTEGIDDDIISAHTPLPGAETRLHEIVKSTMVHGPCGTYD